MSCSPEKELCNHRKRSFQEMNTDPVDNNMHVDVSEADNVVNGQKDQCPSSPSHMILGRFVSFGFTFFLLGVMNLFGFSSLNLRVIHAILV